MKIILNLIGFVISFWYLRNLLSFSMKSFFGRNIWMFEKSAAPIPYNAFFDNQRTSTRSGLILIGIAIILFLAPIPLTLTIGISIGFLLGGIWNYVVGLMGIANLQDAVFKNVYPDTQFQDGNFDSLLRELNAKAQHSKTFAINLPNGGQYDGAMRNYHEPFNIITLYNSFRGYLFISYPFNNEIHCLVSSGKGLVEHSVVENIVVIDESGNISRYS